jgi:hypothetical protein
MLEMSGTVEKIEKSNTSGVDLIPIKVENNQTQIQIELPHTTNPFKDAEPVKIIFDPKDVESESQKLILNGYIYSIKKKEGINEVLISVGGLQFKIQTPNQHDELSARRQIRIQILEN